MEQDIEKTNNQEEPKKRDRKDNLRKPWAKGESGNLNGRPRSGIRTINDELEQLGTEKAKNKDIQDAINYILNLPLSEVAMLASNKGIMKKEEDGTLVYLQAGDKYPLFYRLVAKELLGKNGGHFLEKSLDRAFGAVTRRTEITGAEGKEFMKPPVRIIVSRRSQQDKNEE